MARKPAPTAADKHISLTVPAALMPFVDLFRERFEAAHSAPLGQHEALLTLIRRGLRASPEMPGVDGELRSASLQQLQAVEERLRKAADK